MSSRWLLKQLVNCFIHKFLKFFDEFHSVSLAIDFWWTLFVFFVFLITCMIWGWLVCHFSLPYFPSTIAWLSCHFTSICWQVSQGFFPCIRWNFFHRSLFCYSFCNVPDLLCVCCFSSRFPFYCYILFFIWCKNTQCCSVCIETRDVCVCTQVGDLCPSAQGVTKHGDRCPSPTGVKDVYDGVSIDSKRIYAYRWCLLLA